MWWKCFFHCKMEGYFYKGFPWCMVRNSPANAGNVGSIPGFGKIPWRRKWQSTPVLSARKSHGQRSQVGYSPWGHKESDMTWWLNINNFCNKWDSRGLRYAWAYALVTTMEPWNDVKPPSTHGDRGREAERCQFIELCYPSVLTKARGRPLMWKPWDSNAWEITYEKWMKINQERDELVNIRRLRHNWGTHDEI